MAQQFEARPGSKAPPDPHGAGVVQQFLDRMAEALTRGDGETVARMWDVPALVLDDQTVRGISSASELVQFFGGARELYNDRGIVDTRADLLALAWLTERIAIVEVRWPYLDRNGREVGEESSTYTLRYDDANNLRLRVGVMHGATFL
jgi:hypothetical protein